MLDKKRFYADWKIDIRWDETVHKYVTPKCIDKHVFHSIDKNYEIIINWGADYARQEFKPLSVQL